MRRELKFEAESKVEAKKLMSGLSKATEQCALLWASVEEGGRDDGRVLRRALEFEAESKAEAKKLMSGLSKATEQCVLLWASVEEGGRTAVS